MVAAGLAVYGAYEGSQSDQKLAVEMPFSQEVQHAVSRVDDVLAEVGKYSLIVGAGAIGAVKLAGRRNMALREIDFASSHEMSDDRPKKGAARRALQHTFTDKVPVIASVGVALGTFTGGIGTEVSEGPSRPIEAFGTVAPGDSMITQYKEAMPMTQSNVNEAVVAAVQKEAAERGIRATSLNLNLGVTTTQANESFPNLTLGTDMPEGSPLDWKSADGCVRIPIAVDTSSGFKVGQSLQMNGVETVVADTAEDMSAINRVGTVMDKEAMNQCLEQGTTTTHAVVLDTDKQTAGDILAEANPGQKPAAVISKDDYKANSEDFWESNSKPITNILSLAALGTVLVSLGGTVYARLVRNRREWAMDLARGVSENQLRSTELLRSTKEGVLASVLGIPMGAAATVGSNAVVSGFNAGMGYKEAMIGAAVGIAGSIGGAAIRLVRPVKLIDVKENTR